MQVRFFIGDNLQAPFGWDLWDSWDLSDSNVSQQSLLSHRTRSSPLYQIKKWNYHH